MKQAEVEAYFRRFEEAERKYLDMDRRYVIILDLSLFREAVHKENLYLLP